MLHDLFSQYGTVNSIKMFMDESTGFKGAGFVQMGSRQDAQNAIDNLNDKHQPDGASNTVQVRFADTRHLDRNQQQKGAGKGAPAYPAQPVQQWAEYFDAAGRPYYHNASTGVTQWERPQEMGGAPPPAYPHYPHYAPAYGAPPAAYGAPAYGAPPAAPGYADPYGQQPAAADPYGAVRKEEGRA